MSDRIRLLDCAAGPPELPTDDSALLAGLIEPVFLPNVFCDGMVIQPGNDVLRFLGYAEFPARDGGPIDRPVQLRYVMLRRTALTFYRRLGKQVLAGAQA